MKFHYPSLEPPPHVDPANWVDWKWQQKNILKRAEDFSQYLQLSDFDYKTFENCSKDFKSAATPYYAALAAGEISGGPIRSILFPSREEVQEGTQQMLDPLGEVKHSPTPRIIHRYPDRVLFLITDICSVYCRYCTRKHFTGNDQALAKSQEYQQALKYIANSKGVREVILSGGDPMTLSDGVLLRVVSDLRKIEHVEIIRIGTRAPIVNPFRITKDLVEELKKFHPVFFMVHFNHPKEITAEAAGALTQLVDNGFPVMNQMVLLNGVNNHPAVVQALSRRLLYLRVKPYYMFQADPSLGTDHMRTHVTQSREIQKELWGRLSGLAMPNLSLDIPDGGGKAGLTPNFINQESEDKISFTGWDGLSYDYVNPPLKQTKTPLDIGEYIVEWDQIKNQPYGG